MTSQKPARRFNTLTDFMRYYTKGITTRLGMWLYQRGVHPDVITLVGTAVVALAAYVASQGEFFWAAIIILIGAPLDAVDGAVARAMQRKDKFGALLDSTLDRYADGFILTGLAYYFSTKGNETAMLLAVAAMLGTQLVSYVRARAEGLDFECKEGLFTRMERMVVILVMLLTGYVVAGLWILAIGTHITVIQRIWYVRRAMQESSKTA